MAHDDGINTQMTALVGLIGAIIVFVLIIVAQVFYYHLERREHAAKVVERAPSDASEMLQTQRLTMNEYRWVDKEKGIVAIPIQRAMELVVKTRGQ